MSTEPDAGSAGAVEPGFGEPLLEVSNLKKYFGNSTGFLGPVTFDRDGAVPRPTVEREWVRAVDGVDFDIKRGETLGLVDFPQPDSPSSAVSEASKPPPASVSSGGLSQ